MVEPSTIWIGSYHYGMNVCATTMIKDTSMASMMNMGTMINIEVNDIASQTADHVRSKSTNNCMGVITTSINVLIADEPEPIDGSNRLFKNVESFN